MHCLARSDHLIVWRPSRRCGFTLLEVMIVIGLIAVFAGMTMPSVMRMFNQQKLTEAAEKVRAAAAGGRVRAIELGIVYQFCFETGGTRFIVVPFEADHVNSKDGNHTGTRNLMSRISGHLPKGISFTSATMGLATNPSAGTTAVSSGGHKLAPSALDGLPDAGNLAGANWSAPILFNPDGSAGSDTTITISDRNAHQIHLRVRGFTGAVSLDRLTMGKRR